MSCYSISQDVMYEELPCCRGAQNPPNVNFTSSERWWRLVPPVEQKETRNQLENDLKSIKHELILHPPPPREEEWDGGSESDWERNVPLWLDPHCSNRNQVPDGGVNVFPCIFAGNAGLTDSDLTALHALSFNETIPTYACHAGFTFFGPLYRNFDPRKLSLLRTLNIRFMIWKQMFELFMSSYVTNCCSGMQFYFVISQQIWHNWSLALRMNDSIKMRRRRRMDLWRYNRRPSKKTELVATLMDWDQSLLLPQPHNLNPDIHHMCGSSGKMNSTWEYMVRKFIAHACDEPSGAGGGGGGAISPAPRALFPLGWEEQSPRLFKGAWCKTSWPTTWPNRVGEISFLTSGIFPLQPWGSIPHQSPDTHGNSGIQITCVQVNKWATGGEGGKEGERTKKKPARKTCQFFRENGKTSAF